MQPLGDSRSQRGAASWWMLLVLALVASAGLYIWYQQNQVREPGPRPIQVAQADSSGIIPPLDTARRTDPGGAPITAFPETTTSSGPFIAPSPGFESSRSGPVANLLDYARRMRFDPGRGVEFALPVDEYGRQRVVRLEPLMNLRRLDSTAFAEGRVIARVRSDAAIPAMSLHNGENYVWVQGTLGAPLQAEVWSTSVLASPKLLPLTYAPRPPANAPAGRDAFWLGSDATRQTLWIACGRGWCHS